MSLDHNCLSHSNTQNNEATVKAFKMACLTYKPSEVQFEKINYTRIDLIQSKQTLIQYCLGKLKHLDLGNIQQAKFQAKFNNSKTEIDVDPKHVPFLPSTQNLKNSIDMPSFMSLSVQKQPFIANSMMTLPNSTRNSDKSPRV